VAGLSWKQLIAPQAVTWKIGKQTRLCVALAGKKLKSAADGFIDGKTAATTVLLSGAAVGLALWPARRNLSLSPNSFCLQPAALIREAPAAVSHLIV
jgi:hypothetical protein